jgi:hypothetical protein
MKRKSILILMWTVIVTSVHAQVGINTENPHPSAILDIVAPNKNQGVVFPYVTNDYEKINNPADGLWVYNPSTGCFHFYREGAGWSDICGEQMASFVMNCDSITLTAQGQYIHNQRLDATNTLILHCYVKKPGNYMISAVAGSTPGADNGYSFTASGMAIRAGWQDILLQGSGIPVAVQTDKIQKLILQGQVFSCSAFPDIEVKEEVALYSLNCSSVMVWGEYRKGTPLIVSNLIQMTVNVSKPGSYNIVATSDGGIRFSFSGAWTATGTQTVYLLGEGTPTKNESIDVFITANTPQGNNNCSVKIPVIIPKLYYAIIGNVSTWTWGDAARVSALKNPVNFGPKGIFKSDGFEQLWQTASATSVVSYLNSGYTGGSHRNVQPDILLFFSYGIDNISPDLISALIRYINAGGCVLYAPGENPNISTGLSRCRSLIAGVFGSAYGDNNVQLQVAGIPTADNPYPIANNPNDPIINGPFGNLAGKCWGEDNTSSNQMILKTLPPGSVQICSANTPYGKPDVNPEYSMVWYNDAKNFVYFGDSGGASATSTSTGDYPSYYPNARPAAKRYGGSSSTIQYVYNSALEFNCISWMIKKAAVNGINPH